MIIALIDGDILLHRCAYQAEQEVNFDGDIQLVADHEEGCKALRSATDAVQAAVNAERVIVCLSDMTKNFRRDYYPNYKAQRRVAGSRKPTGFKALRDWYEDNYLTVTKDGLEADDLLGIIATSGLPQHSGTKIMCSIDKDLLTIPGLHFNWDHPEDKVFKVNEWQAKVAFIRQVLIGDSTDGYPGLKGCGPKGADKILDGAYPENDDLWDRVEAAYKAKGFTRQTAVIQARCARILQADDYNFVKGDVIPWEPPAVD